jgi:hypothetical protein
LTRLAGECLVSLNRQRDVLTIAAAARLPPFSRVALSCPYHRARVDIAVRSAGVTSMPGYIDRT